MKRPNKKEPNRGFFRGRRERERETFDDVDRPRERRQAAPEAGAHLAVRAQISEVLDEVRQSEEKTATTLAKPLGDLAKAFALQAELLKNVHETQVKLRQTIEDDRRTEVMLNSTNALNETFRGVRNVQQSLIEKIENSNRANRGVRWALVFAVIVGIGGASWGALELIKRQDSKSDMIDGRIRSFEENVIPDKNRTIDEVRVERDQAKEDARRLSLSVEEMQKEIARLTMANGEIEKRNSILQGSVDAAKTRDDESQRTIADLRDRVMKLDLESRDALSKLEKAQSEIERLHDEVIERLKSGARLPDIDEVGKKKPIVDPSDLKVVGGDQKTVAEGVANDSAKTVRPDETAPNVAENGSALDAINPEKKVVTPTNLAEATRAEASTKATTLLNKLLEKQRSKSSWKIDSIGGVAKEGHIENVVISESLPDRGVVKRISAKKLMINVSPQGDMVDLNFEEGSVESALQGGNLGRPVPFYNQKYRLTILCLNGDEWLRTRESYLTSK